MLHKPIQLQNISLSFGNKICFQAFTHTVYAGSKIGIIGCNGSGKSTLLKMLQGFMAPPDGVINIPKDLIFGYVPQIVNEHDFLSGAERFNKALTTALALQPAILCLDEPTNHLDQKNRQSIIRMLRRYNGTLIMVTHDVELLHICVDEVWHIDGESICCFAGSYDNYLAQRKIRLVGLEQKLKQLQYVKKQAHIELMQEQQRAKNKKAYGQKKYGKDGCGIKAVASQKQNNAEVVAGKNHAVIASNKAEVLTALHNLKLPEVIVPKFNLTAADCSANKTLVYIDNGTCGYNISSKLINVLNNIKLQVNGAQHIAIKGANATGKSTLIKAILNNASIARTGTWQIINTADIGYLDQHYHTLIAEISVLDVILRVNPRWDPMQARRHLNDFLFCKDAEVQAKVRTLSGGEKARLSLAQIAASSPKLIILDEVTNNLDLATREHMIQILQVYPGAILFVSHDEDFLARVRIDTKYEIIGGKLVVR